MGGHVFFAACLCGRCMCEQPIALYISRGKAEEEAAQIKADPETTCGELVFVFSATALDLPEGATP